MIINSGAIATSRILIEIVNINITLDSGETLKDFYLNLYIIGKGENRPMTIENRNAQEIKQVSEEYWEY